MMLRSQLQNISTPTFRRITGILAAVAAIFWIHVEAQTENDFDIFLAAACDLGRRENIYTALYRGEYHYYYSVLFAWALQPLAALPAYWAKAVWLSLNIAFLLRTAKLCADALPLHMLATRGRVLFAVLAAFASMRLLRDNFHSGQLTLCLLWLSLEGLTQIMRGKKVLGGSVIALAINIKLLPLVLIPYLLYRREIQAALAVVFVYAGLLWLPALLVGADYNALLLREWWALVNPTNARHIIDVSERGLHGLSTLLPILFMPDVQETQTLPVRRHLASLSTAEVSAMLMAARLVLAAFTLYFLRTLPFRAAPSALHRTWEMAYILLVVPLIFPHQQHYAFLFAVPAVLYVLAFYIVAGHTKYPLRKQPEHIFGKVVLIAAILGMNAAFILGEFRDYYDHFKVLTWATLLLIIPLAMCRPKLLEKEQSAG